MPETKKHKLEHYDALKRERDAYAEYAWHIVNRKDSDASDFIPGDRTACEVTEFHVYGAARSHGGIVATIHRYDGQSASLSVDYFDAWAERIRALGYATDHTSALQYVRERLIGQYNEAQRDT